MPEGDVLLALAHYQSGFKPLLYGINRGVDPDFFPEGNRTGEEEDMNSIFSTSRGKTLS